MRPPLPPGFRVALDPGVRRRAGGTVLVGGSPLRVLRITAGAVRVLDAIAAGGPVEGPAAVTLARRLLVAGMAHPRPLAGASVGAITAVVPVRDDAPGLDATLGHLAVPCVVVDDGSADGDAIAAVAARHGVALLRRTRPGGPAAARNDGLAEVRTPLVLFLDAGVLLPAAAVGRLAGQLADPEVAAAAPRVLPLPAASTPGWLAAYELWRSPLDMGGEEAPVAPRRRVAYVPTAALLARTEAVRSAGCFDPTLRHGEDVDLVWRLAAAGTIRYVPGVTASHPMRPGPAAWLRQRYGYGTSAAPLARRHAGAVAPLRLSPWTAGAWAAAGAGLPAAGLAIGAAAVVGLERRLRAVLPESRSEAMRLAGLGQLRAGTALAAALRRDWWPLTLAAALAGRRLRPALAAAVAIPPLAAWARLRPGLDPVRWLLLWLADDAAYGAGVWRGCLAERSARALLPDLVRSPAPLPVRREKVS